MKDSHLIASVIGVIILTATTVASAATITYNFTAEINQTNNSLIPNGETFTGTFTADPNTFLNEAFGPSYVLIGEQTLRSISIGFLGAIATTGGISVQNDRDAGEIIDKLAPEAGFIGVSTGIRSYSWNTQDNDATILSDSSLPLHFPLSELESAVFHVQFKAGSGYCKSEDEICNATGIITEIFISQVPLPASAWVFGAGLLALTGIARRKKSPQQY